jgi:hypothetical protein
VVGPIHRSSQCRHSLSAQSIHFHTGASLYEEEHVYSEVGASWSTDSRDVTLKAKVEKGLFFHVG